MRALLELVRDLAGSKTFRLAVLGAAATVEEWARGAISAHQALSMIFVALLGVTIRHAIETNGQEAPLPEVAAEMTRRLRAGDDPDHDHALEILERGFLEVAKKAYAEKNPQKEPPIQ